MTFKWLPSPPTDNLYKYAAISGLWLSLGFSLIFVIYIKTSYSLQDYDSLLILIANDKQNIKKEKDRIASLEIGKIKDNTIPGISNLFAPPQELLFLKNSLALDEKRETQYKQNIIKLGDPKSDWKWIQRSYLGLWLPVSIPLSFLISFIGFRLWYLRNQKYADEILILERNIKIESLKQARRSRLNNH